MIHRLTALFRRAKRVFQTEGLVPLLRKGFAFLTSCFFQYETYYLLEHAWGRIEETSEDGYLPRIQDFTFKVISTNRQANELVSDGFESLSLDGSHRDRLDKGAIAFCIFIGLELANIAWVAIKEEAKESILDLPIKVDFSNNEAFLGGDWTHPEYRGMRLQVYSLFKRHQFLKEKKVAIWRCVVGTRNIASLKGISEFNPRIYAKAQYLKILWWKYWKEMPTTVQLSEKLGSN